uniref:Uncharacterized protein n=1 Tax=Oryza barthii TaxID=65489 RepID=A0A0D3FV79_9ORYZ
MARWTLRLLLWVLAFGVILSQLLRYATIFALAFGFGDGFAEEDALVRIVAAAAVAAFFLAYFR